MYSHNDLTARSADYGIKLYDGQLSVILSKREKVTVGTTFTRRLRNICVFMCVPQLKLYGSRQINWADTVISFWIWRYTVAIDIGRLFDLTMW